VAETDTVGDLKALIFSQTTIPVERQKILNLCKGKLPEDDVVLEHLNLRDRPKKEFSVLGEQAAGWIRFWKVRLAVSLTIARNRDTFG
jgi:hypothetical protein